MAQLRVDCLPSGEFCGVTLFLAEDMILCHNQEEMKIGIDDFSYKELDADHWSDFSCHGLDNERHLQIP